MKILVVLDVLRYGGAQKIAVNLAEALCDKGHEVKIYCYAGQTGPIDVPEKIEVLKGKPFHNNRYLRHLLKIVEIRKVLKSEEVDVAVAFMTYPSILSILANIGLKSKIIVSERGNPYSYHGFIKHIGFKIFRFADGAVFQTEGAKDYFSGKLRKVSAVIPNPVIDKGIRRKELNQRKNTIAFVGRFELKQKRQDVMLEAFSNIHEKIPDLTLTFYGDGEDIDLVKEMAKQRGLASYVYFAGKCDNIEERLAESRMFVMTSDYEGIPNALIEAMSVGIPCVSTDCEPGGARLLIEDRINGRIVPLGDSKAIAEACIEILNDPITGEKYGDNSQKICEKFNQDNIFEKWNNYILEVKNEH